MILHLPVLGELCVDAAKVVGHCQVSCCHCPFGQCPFPL